MRPLPPLCAALTPPLFPPLRPDFQILVNMTSIGTLVMFWFVAISLLYRRYGPGIAEESGADGGGRELLVPLRTDPFFFLHKGSETARCYLVAFWMLVIVSSSIIFTVFFNASTDGTWAQPFASLISFSEDDGSVLVVPSFAAGMSTSMRRRTLIAMAVTWFVGTLGLQLCCPMAYIPPKVRPPSPQSVRPQATWVPAPPPSPAPPLTRSGASPSG